MDNIQPIHRLWQEAATQSFLWPAVNGGINVPDAFCGVFLELAVLEERIIVSESGGFDAVPVILRIHLYNYGFFDCCGFIW